MATASLEAIRRITIEAQEKGLADVAAKLDKIARAQEGVVASSTSVEKSTGSTEQAFKRVERSLDTNVLAYERYAAAVKAVNNQLAQGGTTQQRAAELINLAEVRLRRATGTMNAFGKATTGPARHEMINFNAQLQDIGVSLQGGQSPFTVMSQQIPQIATVVANSEASLKDFVMTAVNGAGRFLAAWAPLALTVTAVGAAAVAAMHVLNQEKEARIATTSGRGRFLGASPADITGATDRSRVPGTSLGEAREGVLEFVRAGTDSLDVIEQANALALRYAATLRMDLAPAQKELAQAMADPAKGVDALNDKLRFLTATEVDHVKSLAANNKETEAALFIIQRMPSALTKAADATSFWGREFSDLVTQFQKGAEALGNVITMQQPGAATPRGRAIAEQQQAIRDKPGFATAIPGEAPRTGAVPQSVEVKRLAQVEAELAQAYEQTATAAQKAAIEQDRIDKTIRNANAAFEDQVRVMNAVTVEERAAATTTQVFNEAIRNNANEEIARNAATIAGNKVRAEAIAQTTQRIAQMQTELDMTKQLTEAAAQTGTAGVRARAEAAAELAIRKQGVDTLTEQHQQEIALAGNKALSEKAVADAGANRQVIESQQAQLALGPQMIEAAKLQGEEGVRARAALQEQQNLLAANIPLHTADSQARIANAAAIAAQAAAIQSANTIRQQEIQLDMGAQNIEAAKVPGAEGERLRAGMQEEQRIRQEGLDVLSEDSQRRIENAKAISDQARELKSAQTLREQQTAIADLGNELKTLSDAYRLTGKERVIALAAMREENQIIKEGLDVTSKMSQERIKNAQTIAMQKNAIEDVVKVRQTEFQLSDTLEMIQLETQLIGENDAVRQSSIVSLQYEQKAREAEREGLLLTAEAYRSYGAAIASATYAREKRRMDLADEGKPGGPSGPSFAAGSDKPLSQRGGFESTARLTWAMYQDRDQKQRAKTLEVQKQIDDAQKAGQQRQLQIASQTAQDQIQALNDQKTAIQENTDALEKEGQKRKEQLDKQISKLEKALNPSRPDPYAERNPDYFYRFGTQAFKENDPMQALLAAAEAERDGLDGQLEQQKKAIELQQKAIDEQIKGYEAQIKELERAGNLLSAGVDLSAQELAGIKGIIAAIAGLGDFARLQTANVQSTLTAAQSAAKAGGDPAGEFAGTVEYMIERMVRGQAYAPITPAYGFQKSTGFKGMFASGGYIPAGSWGIAGESGPEVIDRRRKVVGPATVTPINAGRPIVVNQTIVSQGSVRELRASRGEIAQRSSSEMRRSLGAR